MNQARSNAQKRTILSHIEINGFSEDVLKYVVRKCEEFAADSSMWNFQISCMRQLSFEKFSFESTSYLERRNSPRKPRNSRLFTFKQYLGTIRDGASETEGYCDGETRYGFWGEIENDGAGSEFQLKVGEGKTVPEQSLYSDCQIFVYYLDNTAMYLCNRNGLIYAHGLSGYIGATVYF